MKMLGIVILVVFYFIYIGKLLIQKKKGIQTDQIARGKKKGKVFYIELIMKIATYSVVVVEIISIFTTWSPLPMLIIKVGIALGVIGDAVFATAVITMRDSWRAGIAENEKTEMITSGIYEISRNPAFLGFDCVYISLLLMFFNWTLLLFTLFAMTMLHLQILQEERYLPNVFGEEYLIYKSKVHRYLGRKMK